MTTAVPSPIADALRSALPWVRVTVDREEVERHRWDATEFVQPGTPAAVAFPRTTEEVSSIVRLAAEQHVPIVPRGAGTGLSGGATGLDGALSLV